MNDSVAMELPTAMTDPMKKTAVINTIFTGCLVEWDNVYGLLFILLNISIC